MSAEIRSLHVQAGQRGRGGQQQARHADATQPSSCKLAPPGRDCSVSAGVSLTSPSSARHPTAVVVSEKWPPEADRLPDQRGPAHQGPDVRWNVVHLSALVLHGHQERIQQEEKQGALSETV